jgi:Fe-S cluster biogenesis protein NfuA
VTWGLNVEFIDTIDLAAVRAAIQPGRTRLLWLETPANPTWDITDLAAVSEIAHAADVRVAVDSTVATPVLTRPVEFGADLVIHSATKYLNGHSDVLAGAVVTARRDPFWERIRSWRRNAGAVLGPFEAWLLQRGMRTLFVRVRRSSESALALARHFHGHPALTAVLYPGLSSHPGHEIAARQMTGGFGGMLSIRVRGDASGAMAVAAAVRVFKRATSLGGVESLIEHRRSTEGPSSPVPEDLLRLSIGLEAPSDLIRDLEAALDQAMRASPAGGPPIQSTHTAASPGGADLAAAVTAALERSVTPIVVARGGAVRVIVVNEGVVTLEASGSPGAILPATAQVEALLRAAIPELTEVRVVWPGREPAPMTGSGDLLERLRRVLDEEVNPAIAAHRGRVSLVDFLDGRVRIRLEGGCQGCSLADVTVRQGIERLLRGRFAEVVASMSPTTKRAPTPSIPRRSAECPRMTGYRPTIAGLGRHRVGRSLAVGALLAGLVADWLGMAAAIHVVAALTLLSGVVILARMGETLGRPG